MTSKRKTLFILITFKIRAKIGNNLQTYQKLKNRYNNLVVNSIKS